MVQLTLAADVLDAIDVHARAEAPRECCGLLLGRLDRAGEPIAVEQAVPTGNISPSPTRYLIDPADHFRVIRSLRNANNGLEIIGAYHSHPASRPVPSPTDLAEALPHFLYLIATPRAGAPGSDVRAWLLDAGNFREVPLVFVA